MHPMMLMIYTFMAGWKIGWCAPVPTRMIDLTHVFDNTTLNWPDVRKFELNATYLEYPGLDKIAGEEFSSATHVGTHMDAPCHFVANRQTITDIPLERLIAPAAVVDVSEKAALDSDYQLQKKDLLQWESTTGHLLNEVIVLVRTGWSKNWSNRTAYIGNSDNNSSNLHFPGVSPSASRWIVSNRTVYGIGVETLSLDYGPSKNFRTHMILGDKNIYGLENVGSLDDLPVYGATLHVMPMKLGGSCGAPVRIVATFPDVIYRPPETESTRSTEKPFHEVIRFA